MIDPAQLRDLVVEPVLQGLGMWSPAAEKLVMGTFACESDGGKYLHQLNGGPALGFWQVEPLTGRDMVFRYLSTRPDLASRFEQTLRLRIDDLTDDALLFNLQNNLAFGAVMCRIKFWTKPEPLPAANDLLGLAQYYKTHYNSSLGAATTRRFIDWWDFAGLRKLYG